MQQEMQTLDYRAVQPVVPVRPRMWLSQMMTAAALCVVAIGVDHYLRYDWLDARRVIYIEVALTIYGTTCGIVSVARGALTKRDKAAVIACALVFAWTAYVAMLRPRVIHN